MRTCPRSPRTPRSRAAASSSPARWSSIRSRSRTMSASTSAPPPAASPRCCCRTAPAWCSPSMSGAASCIRRCTAIRRIVSMEETDIRTLRRQAAAGAARYRRHRRQLHLAEGGAAGGAVAGRRADASAGADQAAIRGRRGNTPSTASSATRWCIRKSATTSRRSPTSLGCTDIQVFPSPITGGDGNIEFFLGARRG